MEYCKEEAISNSCNIQGELTVSRILGLKDLGGGRGGLSQRSQERTKQSPNDEGSTDRETASLNNVDNGHAVALYVEIFKTGGILCRVEAVLRQVIFFVTCERMLGEQIYKACGMHSDHAGNGSAVVATKVGESFRKMLTCSFDLSIFNRVNIKTM